MESKIDNVLVVGGGTAGWMTATYLKKSFPDLNITLIEAPTIPRIGVGEATVPNLQRVFFDHLGFSEEDWMPRCNAAYKVAVKFMNWKSPRGSGATDQFFHPFGILPNIANVPLTHYWFDRYQRGERRAMDYSCFAEPAVCDALRSPRFEDGTRAVTYAWHFDAHLVAEFLAEAARGWGVKHIVGLVEHVNLDASGSIESVLTKDGQTLAADFFVDCSGFRGLLINKALGEPFEDISDRLLCDSAVASCVPHDDARHGVEPYTSAIAMNAGWTWKTPMLGRFGSGYVYSSKFCSEDKAAKEFCDLWGLDPDTAPLRRIRFRAGRNRRAWVKNCASIGLASCFVEPLEASGIYFIYAALYQLAKYFPDKSFDPVLRDRFNREIETMFDDTRDFLQAHYLTTPREDTAFWRANRHELKVSDSLADKLETYRSGLVVNMPIADESTYYGSFEAEFRNFWTNGSYYCILAGMGWLPDKVLPSIAQQSESREQAARVFDSLDERVSRLVKDLPSNYEALRRVHGVEAQETMDEAAAETASARPTTQVAVAPPGAAAPAEDNVRVFAQSALFAPSSPATGGLRLGAFHNHDALGDFLPDEKSVGFSWLDLAPGAQAPPARSDKRALVVVYGGSGHLRTDAEREVRSNDIVAIPAGAEYTLGPAGKDGLRGIVVEFEVATRRSLARGTIPVPEFDDRGQDVVVEARSIETLLARNEEKLSEWLKGPFFTMLRDGTLDDPSRRAVFLGCIQVVSDAFQQIMLGRQATCSDPRFAPVFFEHLREEIGHNTLLAARPASVGVSDPILVATANWFAHRMFVADNADKAVLVHLILEAAGHHFHSFALSEIGEVGESYYEVHAHHDEEHTEMGIELIRGLDSKTYSHLHGVLEHGWKMFEEMTVRITKVVRATPGIEALAANDTERLTNASERGEK